MKLLPLIFIILLSSCVETLVISTISVGTILTRDKSMLDTKKDILIDSSIRRSFAKNGLKKISKSVYSVVDEGRVLLIGVIKNEKDAKKAVDLAWKVKNVTEVIDEIQISKKSSIINPIYNSVKDSYITSRIRSKLLLSKRIISSNIKIVTVNKIVYLFGIAQDRVEIDKATKIASKIKGVKEVVSHIILKNDSRR